MKCFYPPLKKSAYSVLVLLLVGNCFLIQNGLAKLHTGMKAIPFTLNDFSGNSQTFSRISEGKQLTAIIFWATWNEQSSTALARLQKFYSDYQQKGLQVIAVNIEGQTVSKNQIENIVAYCNKMGITFPVLIDQNLDTFHHYSIVAIPTIFLIDDEGTIVYKLPGYPMAGAEQLFSTMKDIMEPEPEQSSPDQTRLRLPDKKALRYYQMAMVLQEKGDYPSSVESLQKSITIDPDFLAAYNRLGIALYNQGKHKEAVEVYNKALSRNPDDLPFLADYGNFLIRMGDTVKGVTMIKKVLAEDPNYSRGHYYLGSYLLQQGKKDESLREAQKAAQLNPLDFKAQRLLGSVYESLGKKKESFNAYKKAAILLEKRVKSQNYLLGLSL